MWALRDSEWRKVDFEETWAILLYEAFVSQDEVDVVTAGVEERFALGYTPIVDNEARNGTDP